MIREFQGPYRFLSNFWPAKVRMDGVFYPSVEHAYVASKTLDLSSRREIARVQSPGQVKRMGRALVLRPDWDEVKLPTMRSLVLQKFTRHEVLMLELLSTGNLLLEEGNTWGDTFWGVCRGVGENHLGQILMQVRSQLSQGHTDDPS